MRTKRRTRIVVGGLVKLEKTYSYVGGEADFKNIIIFSGEEGAQRTKDRHTLMGDCRNSFFVYASDCSRSGLAENLGQIRFS